MNLIIILQLVKNLKQELDRIKNIDNSVFYLKGKKGFNGKDDPYLEWITFL